MTDGRPRPDDAGGTTAEPDDRFADLRPPDGERNAGGLSFEVPDGAEAVECEYCERPFEADERLALHRGLAHAESLSPDGRAAFEEAREAETDRLRTFRLKALLALVVLYFGLLLIYAVAT